MKDGVLCIVYEYMDILMLYAVKRQTYSLFMEGGHANSENDAKQRATGGALIFCTILYVLPIKILKKAKGAL